MLYYLDQFFLPQVGAFSPADAYRGMYDPALVVTSVAIAVLFAFVALSIAARMAVAGRSVERLAWAFGGAVCMGGGIWSMHFVGMLAFELPCIVGYDATGTLFSMLPGALASGAALFTLSRPVAPTSGRLLVGALFMGGGIGAMHYSGMAAMRPAAILVYDPLLVGLSIVVAVLLAFLSLGFQFRYARFGLADRTATLVAATIMGFAIAGMHYTAMEAALFFPLEGYDSAGLDLAPGLLALVIAIIAVLVAAIALATTNAARQIELVSRLSDEVAQRTRIEGIAREGQARLQAIVDSVADAVITIDRAGQIRQWNSGAEQMFGYGAGDAVGADIRMLMPEPHRAGHQGYIDRFLDSREPRVIGIGRELVAVRRNGEEFPVDLQVTEVQGIDDVMFTGILRDITERKRAERELIEARRQAEEASRAKSGFLATMSHEIRTPMHGVLGIARLLSSTPLNARQGQLVQNLIRSGQALTGVINEILDFSKIEAGHVELFDVEFDLREMMSEIAVLFGEQCHSKGLEFIYFIDEGVPTRLRGDPVRLRQVLVNLAGNAIKFTERGEILIELTLGEVSEQGLTLGFAVSDTGIGIPGEHQATIFESFRQADESMSRARGGTGLGLSITRQLVELMDGEIDLDSEVGRGSQFRFTVRLRHAAESGDAPRPSRRLPRSLSALLLDANRVSACVIARYLKGWNVETTKAASLSEAREVLLDAGSPPDVLILDLRTLNAHTSELPAEIDALRSDAKTEIILLEGMEQSVLAGDPSGLDAYATLMKPVRPSDLFDSLSAVAAGSPSPKLAGWLARTPTGPTRSRFNARVLLAEDNSVNQDVAEAVLENLGCEVFIAPDGASAVQAFGEQVFDLVLMDCEMPEIDGFEATRRIREIERVRSGEASETDRRAAIPIIAVTAHALPEMRDRCLEAGMNDFVVKPYDENQLAEAMQRWIDLAPGPQDGVAGDASPAMRSPAAVGTDTAGSLLDPALIAQIQAMEARGRTGLLADIVEKFADGARAKVGEMRACCDKGDGEGLRLAAHALRSSAAAVGARELMSRCSAIEAMAGSDGAPAARPSLEDLDGLLEATLEALGSIGVGRNDDDR